MKGYQVDIGTGGEVPLGDSSCFIVDLTAENLVFHAVSSQSISSGCHSLSEAQGGVAREGAQL